MPVSLIGVSSELRPKTLFIKTLYIRGKEIVYPNGLRSALLC